MAFEVS